MIHRFRGRAGVTAGALAALLLCGAGASNPASTQAARHSGPFGIDIGEPLADVGRVEPMGNGYYQVLSPSVTNPRIATVVVVAYPSTGVCQIMAKTDVNQDDPAAVSAKRDVDDFVSALSTKYGPSFKKVETCDDSDGGCATALARKIAENTAKYMYGWNFDAAHRPDHIGIVAVGVTTQGPTATATMIDYISDRAEACNEAEAAASASGL